MIPTTGRIVHYTLGPSDVDTIKRNRSVAGTGIAMGNEPHEGDILPMLIVKPWGEIEGVSANGQVFLDGNDTYWATSRGEGEGPGYWAVPPRV
jgi:hypothetical protein